METYAPKEMVQLIGPDEKPLDEVFEVVELIDKNIYRVKDSHGTTIRVFKSRIYGLAPGKNQVTTNGQINGQSAQRKENTMTEATAAPVEEAVETKEAKKITVPAVKKETKPASAAKEAKPKKAPQPFDLDAWVKEHGGANPTHMVKAPDFQVADFQLQSHVLLNPDENVYYTLNVYKYPDGTHSLGKNGSGGNKYPLKGKRFNVKEKTKDGAEESRTKIGKQTLEEKVAEFSKKGYKIKAKA